jgi:hypothetical protein
VPAKYDENNRDQVFAALSFRLAIDVCAANPRVMLLVDRAVGSHLCVIDGLDPNTGIISSLAPSEPILAQAAIELLNSFPTYWMLSVNKLTQKFVQCGFMERGLKGELFARLVLAPAHDAPYQRALPTASPTEPLPLKEMPLTPVSFSVREFLTKLVCGLRYLFGHHRRAHPRLPAEFHPLRRD